MQKAGKARALHATGIETPINPVLQWPPPDPQRTQSSECLLSCGMGRSILQQSFIISWHTWEMIVSRGHTECLTCLMRCWGTPIQVTCLPCERSADVQEAVTCSPAPRQQLPCVILMRHSRLGDSGCYGSHGQARGRVAAVYPHEVFLIREVVPACALNLFAAPRQASVSRLLLEKQVFL